MSIIPIRNISECIMATTGGNANASACVFPYIFEGVSYDTCIIGRDGPVVGVLEGYYRINCVYNVLRYHSQPPCFI